MAFFIDESDIQFVIFDQLRATELLARRPSGALSRDDAQAVLDQAWRFAREEIAPIDAPSDELGCHFEDGRVQVPPALRALYAKYVDAGWLGLNASEDRGGADLPNTVSIGAAEVLTGASSAFSPYPALSRGVAHVLEGFGTEWQKQVVVPKIYSGAWLGTMCLTEPQAGSAVGDVRTQATRDGDSYLIQGSKIFITAGEHDIGENIIHLVLARTPDAPKGVKGLSLFMVPKLLVAKDGSLGARNDVTCVGIEEKMGQHASSTCSLNFGDNGTCRGWLVGEERRGIEVMFHLMNEARLGTGVQAFAQAALAYQIALAYAKERVQGVEIQNMRDVDAPRVPIVKHPDVKRMLFTMKAQVEGMRALLYRTANAADESRLGADDEARQKGTAMLELLTPICKAYCSDVGFDVTVMAMQVLGGAGYVTEGGVEQLVRDTKVCSIYEGTNGIQALDLVGRKLGAKGGLYFMTLMAEMDASIAAWREHPVLGDLARLFEEEQGRLREVTGQIGMAGMSGDVVLPTLGATTYLTMLGNLVLGWLLLDQAVIAHERLSALAVERGARTEEERETLVAESGQAAFYANKLHTASFFLKNLLVENRGLAPAVVEGYRDILRATL